MKKIYYLRCTILCLVYITSVTLYAMEKEDPQDQSRALVQKKHSNNENENQENTPQLPHFIRDSILFPSSTFDTLSSIDPESLRILLEQIPATERTSYLPFIEDDSPESKETLASRTRLMHNLDSNDCMAILKKNIKTIQANTRANKHRVSDFFEINKPFILQSKKYYWNNFKQHFSATFMRDLNKLLIGKLAHLVSEYLENTEIKYLYDIDLPQVKRSLSIFMIAEKYETIEKMTTLVEKNESILVDKLHNLLKNYSRVTSSMSSSR